MHFLDEERTEPYKSTVKGVLAGEKCAGYQEGSGHAAMLHDRLTGAEVVRSFGYD